MTSSSLKFKHNVSYVYLKFKNIVLYLEKWRCDIETWAIDKVLIKKKIQGIICRICAPETSPTSLFNFGK